MTSASVVAPVTETLIRIQGKPMAKRVQNLIFQGLEFAHTDYNLQEVDGSHGKATGQTACVSKVFANPDWHLGVYRSYDILPGAIVVSAVENLVFLRNTITRAGCEGLVIINDASHVEVIGNVISDSGRSAITIGHPQHVYAPPTFNTPIMRESMACWMPYIWRLTPAEKSARLGEPAIGISMVVSGGMIPIVFMCAPKFRSTGHPHCGIPGPQR